MACEESQAVTIELRKLGHEAYSCDVLECSGGHPEWHLKQDVTPLLKEHWDMILAFPPCTYLSAAGACRLWDKGKFIEERYRKGLEAKEFFMMFYNAPCEKVAIENPVSLKIYDLPPYTQQVHPWMFGEPYTKRIRLWLKGLPKLEPTNIVEPIGPWVAGRYANMIACKDSYAEKIGGDRRINRAKTFKGVAQAMALQWAGKNDGGENNTV